jgi:succinate dehydrogenase / fumarate reductase flavoprotein subunit
MQGLADGYFVLPSTIGNYFGAEGADIKRVDVSADSDAAKEAKNAVDERIAKLMSIKGERSPDSFHRELGKICWDNCGMARNKEGLTSAIEQIQNLRDEFWQNLRVLGDRDTLNQSLEKAGRVADFLEFGELMVRDALNREESCGGHFREEHQTPEGEAKRNDEDFTYVAAWEFNGVGNDPTLHKEELEFEYVKLTQRSYK